MKVEEEPAVISVAAGKLISRMFTDEHRGSVMPLRYFDNPYDDLRPGQEIEIDYRLWKTRIKEIVENILRKEAVMPPRRGQWWIDSPASDD